MTGKMLQWDDHHTALYCTVWAVPLKQKSEAQASEGIKWLASANAFLAERRTGEESDTNLRADKAGSPVLMNLNRNEPV